MKEFDSNAPKNKTEKMILELIEELHKTTDSFVGKYSDEFIDYDMYIVLQSGIMGYAGSTIHKLMKGFDCDVYSRKELAEKSKKLFDMYMNFAVKECVQ